MKKLTFAALSLLLAACSTTTSKKVTPSITPDADIEALVKEIVGKMSLDDKVGQMCEVTIDLVCASEPVDGQPVADPAKLDTVIGKYRVGSVLHTF